MKILIGVVGKYRIIDSYDGHIWNGFWLKVLDARETFPLGT